jgi:hypothetical protein
MKSAILSAALAAAFPVALSGCAKKADPSEATQTAAGSGESLHATDLPTPAEILPDGFPQPAAAYSGVFTLGAEGAATTATIRADRATQRIEFPPGAGLGAGRETPWRQIMVVRDFGEKISMWPEGEGAPKLSALIQKKDMGALATTFGVNPERAKMSGKKIGEDTIANQRCAIWEVAAEEEGREPMRACVTRDGIVLRVAEGENAPVILAQSIERGPQAAALFEKPAGYDEIDMGECMRAAGEMMAAMQSGKAPKIDMAKMQRCQEAGQKFGAIFGQ